MRLAIYASWAGVVLGCVMGCGQQGRQGGAGNVAVIDLDEIARRLGRDAVMQQAMIDQQSSVNDRLTVLQTTLNETFEDRRRQVDPEAATEEQKQELQTLFTELNQELAVKRQQGINEIVSHRQGLITQFREEVKPIALAVAAERGLDVVVTKNDTVVYAYGEGADITEDVIGRMAAGAAPARTDNSAGDTPNFLPEGDSNATPIMSERPSDEGSIR
jgi:Skp family chaperone for outer membrane proteins